jgi:hypothetical protein
MTSERRHSTNGTRATDASRLSFPLQLVIVIVTGVLSAASGSWATQRGNDKAQAQLQSDVRDILTRMEAERRMSEANAKLVEANTLNTVKAIESISKRQELQQLQIAEISKEIVLLRSQTQTRR